MAKTSYYLAVSLDGFLARDDGSVDWLDSYMEPLNTPFDYAPFYETVSSVVMGRKTYEKVLSFGEYAYKGKPGLVLSRDKGFCIDEAGVEVVSSEVKRRVQTLAESSEGRVWLVGGGEVANLFVRENLLDEIVLTIIPETIGTGVRWLGEVSLSSSWSLSESYQAKNGVIQLVYDKVTSS